MPLIVRVFSANSVGADTGQLKRLGQFYRRRFYRLIPALGSTIAISAILIFIFLPSSEHGRFASLGISALLLIGNFGAYKFSGETISCQIQTHSSTFGRSRPKNKFIFSFHLSYFYFFGSGRNWGLPESSLCLD